MQSDYKTVLEQAAPPFGGARAFVLKGGVGEKGTLPFRVAMQSKRATVWRKHVLLALLLLLFLLLPTFALAQGQVRVRGYVRKDGTYVAPHYRTAPDGNPYNNYSFPGNFNPNTGKFSTGDPASYILRYYTRKASLPRGSSVPLATTPERHLSKPRIVTPSQLRNPIPTLARVEQEYRRYQSDKIRRDYGVAPSTDSTLLDLIELHARLHWSKKIRSGHGLNFPAKDYSALDLIDIQFRLNWSNKIRQKFGRRYSFRNYSALELMQIYLRLAQSR